MASQTVVIVDPAGMHARPASKVAHFAANFDEDIHFTFKLRTIDAKSIMGLMSLGVPKDAELTISSTGENAEEIVGAIVQEMRDLGLIA
jgi:phosphocarrier protein